MQSEEKWSTSDPLSGGRNMLPLSFIFHLLNKVWGTVNNQNAQLYRRQMLVICFQEQPFNNSYAHFKCTNSQLVMFLFFLSVLILISYAMIQRSYSYQISIQYCTLKPGRTPPTGLLLKIFLIVPCFCLGTFVLSQVFRFYLPLILCNFFSWIKTHISHCTKWPCSV